MMISAQVLVDLTAGFQGFNAALSVSDVRDNGEVKEASFGWHLPMRLDSLDWRDFLFEYDRQEHYIYLCVLGFYVRHMEQPGEIEEA